jgi:hypothetical protein
MNVNVAVASSLLLFATTLANAQDPREGLDAGFLDAEIATEGLTHTKNVPKPAGFVDPANPGSFAFVASDLAFSGDHLFVGNFNGWLAYDISDPDNPTLETAVVCPGGQGDLSVYGNLLFVSVEETRARVDCGTDPTVGTRFQGVRIFDISDVTNPVQVAAVQTCRGSHNHTLVTDPHDPDHLYVYNSSTAGPRPAATMAGCNNNPADGENPSRWRIEVIEVPLASPELAAVVSEPRIFADPVTGALDGLQNAPPTPNHPSGAPWGPTPITDGCHDIAAFPELGIAAGACEGNGILLDISDPVNPVRLDAVADPNFAYWSRVSFSNDGTKVVFTDEWGGGTGARCRATDQPEWGATAIFDVVGDQLEFRSYWKLPAAQTLQENCVANGLGIVPVPGRDVFAQGWYQGGHTLVDFTDAANPKEIAFFDRGPISETTALVLGGFWTTYFYNGRTFGSEIARGLDVFRYTPTADLSANEIAATEAIELDFLSPQLQSKIVHAPSFALVRSYLDQALRAGDITAKGFGQVKKLIDQAELLATKNGNGAKGQLNAASKQLKGAQFDTLRGAILDLMEVL